MVDKNHPGYKDLEYRHRRDCIAQIANEYKTPDRVPEVHYAETEHQVWRDILERIRPLHEKYAWSGYLEAYDVANLPSNRIPQLSEVNDSLSTHTGFYLTPVAGLVPARLFLIELMHRRMLSTQYIRHPSAPDYTPEPDIVHELLGHAVPFFTEEYCELNQLFGHAAAMIPDNCLIWLERLYWYTIEFGLIRENGFLKAFGAGLISSAGEIEQIGAVPLKDFCIQDIITTPYNTTQLQPTLFCAPSYTFMRDEISKWLKKVIVD